MPAESARQAHSAQVARAVRHGKIKKRDLPSGLRKVVESMGSMSEAQLEDFSHTRGKTLATRRTG
jgi:uncharacterized phage-associated protein